MTEERKPRMTLAEMAAESAHRVNGRLVCPDCGCADFRAGKKRQVGQSISRYRKCRHCGTSCLTWQPQEQIIRIVDADDDSESIGDDSIV